MAEYIMTEELYNLCQSYEDNLRTALKANYSRYLSRTDGEIIRDNIYNPLFKTIDKRNVGCGRCLLSMLQRIAPYYFNYKENKDIKDIKDGNLHKESECGTSLKEQPKKRTKVGKLQKKESTSNTNRKATKDK